MLIKWYNYKYCCHPERSEGSRDSSAAPQNDKKYFMDFNLPIKKNTTVLALGAESAGNFSVYSPLPNPSPLFKEGTQGGLIYLSPDFGDLLEEKNWRNYKKAVLKYLKDNKIKPKLILTDLHPLFKTTLWGQELVNKFKAKFIQVQHHHAHIFSAVGDYLLPLPLSEEKTPFPSPLSKGGTQGGLNIPTTFYGIAMDGTGYGNDEKIWGGEVFKVEGMHTCHSREGGNPVIDFNIKRIGHLQNQILIGGDLAIQEPARMLISILDKTRCHPELVSESKKKKDFIYSFVKKYYNKNEFELLYNQLQQNFNCLETSSAGRVLDATSLLLGFCDNKREYKHEPIDLLEKNSAKPFTDLKPKIKKDENGLYVLDTDYLFNYVIKYLRKRDKKRLAATAQLYIAEGLYEIILKCHPELVSGSDKKMPKQVRHDNIFISGGLANNKIISSFFESKGAYGAKKIPRGDAGISFGQILYHLLSNN